VRTHRGEIWLADLGKPVGHEQGFSRPVVIVSADRYNAAQHRLVMAVPITSRRRGWNTHVEIEPGISGLDKVSWAKVEDLRSISAVRLTRRLGNVETSVMANIQNCIRLLLDV
jgi:mRNA interferase MazF